MGGWIQPSILYLAQIPVNSTVLFSPIDWGSLVTYMAAMYPTRKYLGWWFCGTRDTSYVPCFRVCKQACHHFRNWKQIYHFQAPQWRWFVFQNPYKSMSMLQYLEQVNHCFRNQNKHGSVLESISKHPSWHKNVLKTLGGNVLGTFYGNFS